MWFQVFLGDGEEATPTTTPLKDLDLLREIERLSKLGAQFTDMKSISFKQSIKEVWEFNEWHARIDGRVIQVHPE